MSYFTLSELEARIPREFLLEALDDNGDGTRDEVAAAAVVKAACEGVDAILVQRYGVPFVGDVPVMVREAARVFGCELLYARRGMVGDKNPWTVRADEVRAALGRIAAGGAGIGGREPSAAAVMWVGEAAGTAPRGRLNA